MEISLKERTEREFMKAKNIDLTQGPIVKNLIRFSIPLLLSSILQQLYSTVDLLIVGRYSGQRDMAAIGATGALSYLIVAFFFGLSLGTSILVSQFYSGKREQKLYDVVHTTFAIAIFGGLGLMILTFIGTPWLLELMETPAEIFEKSVIYMRVYFLGVIPMLVYNMGSGILRSVGDSERPFYFLISSAVLNVVLDLVFVKGMGMGAFGAAVATTIAQFASSLLVFIALLKAKDIYRLEPRNIRFEKESLKNILRIGVPAGLQGMAITLSNVVIQAKINLFGPEAIAGVAGASRIDGFVWLSVSTISQGITIFTGQNIGAQKFDRLKRGFRISLVMITVVTGILVSFIFFFREQFMGLFNSNPEVIKYGANMLAILCSFYLLYAWGEIILGFIRGAGSTAAAMVITLSCFLAIRIAWIYIMLTQFFSVYTVLWSYPVTWLIYAVISAVYFRRRFWRDLPVK